MDTLAHGLWTYAIMRTPKKKIAWFWPVFFAMLPDLIWLSSVAIGMFMRRLGLSSYTSDTLFLQLYNVSHSLFVWLAVTALISLAVRHWFWATWGWAFHILVDVPGHLHAILTPFLWPVSSYHVQGAWDWLSVPWLIGNYVALAAVFLMLRRRRKLTHLP